MLKKQEDKLGMYDSVTSHNLQQAKSIEERYPALHSGYTELVAKVAEIRGTAQLYADASKGQGIFKIEQKAEIVGLTDLVAGAIFAWASDNGNTLLQEKVRYNQSDLAKMRDEVLVNTTQMLYGMANENGAPLAGYGLGKEVVDNFKKAMDNYKAAVPAPRNAVAMRKAYRDKLKRLFKEADNILKNKLDKLVLPLKKEKPEYWSAYKANRRILSSGSNATALGITVKDEATGLAIEGVGVIVEALKWEAHTDKEGQATAKPVPLGTYTAIVKKEGYQPQTIAELKAILGKTNKVEVVLKKAV